MSKIKDYFFYKFFNAEIQRELLNTKNELAQRVRHIQYNANKKTAMYSVMKKVLAEPSNNVIVGIANDKQNEELLVVQQCVGKRICFLLYNSEYEGHHSNIWATYYNAMLGDPPFIKIDDFFTVYDNIGYGSILMRYFLEYCNKTDAHYICGDLAQCDRDHFNRSIHFYEKHGFTCTLNVDKTSGRIKYILKAGSKYNNI